MKNEIGSAYLARAEIVKSRSMSNVITTPGQRGMVDQVHHPIESHQLSVVLTTKGKTIRKDSREAKHMRLAHVIETPDRKKQDMQFEAGEFIKKIVDL